MAPPQRKQEWFFESSKIEVNRNRKFSNFKCILYIALKFIFRIFIPPRPHTEICLSLAIEPPPRPPPPAPAPPRRPGASAQPAPARYHPRRPPAPAPGAPFPPRQIGAPADRRPGGSAPRRIGAPADRRIGGSAPRRIGGSADRRPGGTKRNGARRRRCLVFKQPPQKKQQHQNKDQLQTRQEHRPEYTDKLNPKTRTPAPH